MNHECLPRDKERFEIQMKTQNLVGQQLDLAKTLLAEKLTQEESLQVSFEHELERLKTEYNNFLLSSQARETELLSKLKEKDEKIMANKEKFEMLKISNEKIETDCLDLVQKAKVTEPCSSEHMDTINLPVILENSNIEHLKTELNALSTAWKTIGADEWEEQTVKIEELRSKLNTFNTENRNYLEKLENHEGEVEVLQRTWDEMQKFKEICKIEKEKLRICETELAEIQIFIQQSEEKQENLTEKLKNFKADKETLQNKLEKVYEMLVKENLVSSEHQEMLTAETDMLKKLTEELEYEKAENEKLSELVIQEKMNASRIKEQLAKSRDIDLVLAQTLKQIDMEGAVRKTENGYFYKDSQINLYLHSESLVVVKIGAGLMPLGDFLKNSQMPGKVLMPKNVLGESKADNVSKRELKSPLKSVPAVAIKANRTPLRQRSGITKS